MAKKKSKTRKSLDASLPIYQLKITLQHIHPPIWRRVQTNDCSLSELHDIIQICMGWEDAHAHAFVIDGEECANLDLGGEAEWDSRFVRLSDLVEQGHTLFFYDYDFGDDWRHIIDIEKTLHGKGGVHYPRCVEGKRACPPEDCGGPYGYPYFLDSLQDPENDEHQEVLEWIGDGSLDRTGAGHHAKVEPMTAHYLTGPEGVGFCGPDVINRCIPFRGRPPGRRPAGYRQRVFRRAVVLERVSE